MRSKTILILTCVCVVFRARCEKPKILTTDRTHAFPKKVHNSSKIASKAKILISETENSSIALKPVPFIPILVVPEKPESPKLIDPHKLQIWASEISDLLHKVEKNVVRRDLLLKAFGTGDFKAEERSGAAIVEKMAKDLEDLLLRRVKAAEDIMRKAEELTQNIKKIKPPTTYRFDQSYDLNELKKEFSESPLECCTLPLNCTQLRKLNCTTATHFDTQPQPKSGIAVNLDESSVQTAAEVFPCDERVLKHIYWSERLLPTFKKNYEDDATIDFQHFCSASGFLRHYPAAQWQSMFRVLVPGFNDEDSLADVYDCRLRPWYVAAGGAPRDVLILLDASGSMNRSSNKVHAEQFTAALLNALTDDDQTNVLRFNREVKSPIACFNDKLVSANHINSAAMMSALRLYQLRNSTNMTVVLRKAVQLLHAQVGTPDRPPACQQAIVLLTDSLYYNYSELMMEIDPKRTIRLFVIWLHDVYGLRDNSAQLSDWISCDSDGYYTELLTDSDVTEQVLRIMRVLERPLVMQRRQRLRVFSDVYAHVEDPRRGEFQWQNKENQEQYNRYLELRRNKTRLINNQQRLKDFNRHMSLDALGQYYEGQDISYRFLITVSVPVFESTRSENITITIFEEKQRTSTRTVAGNRMQTYCVRRNLSPTNQLGEGRTLKRKLINEGASTSKQPCLDRPAASSSDVSSLPPQRVDKNYPVNRLLGVAGVDIPIDRLKLIFPYHQLGPGGSLFLVDHRGNIVLHDNLKPTFDGDILKPGYRTVDFLDLEQPARNHTPREYPRDWFELRKAIVIRHPRGNRTMSGKNIFEDSMRATLELREYHWKRVLEHYVAVVVLPKYGRRHAVPTGNFTQELAAAAADALNSEITIHPDWLYCRFVDPQYFNEREFELRHFLNRRRDTPGFKMEHTRHDFSAIFQTISEKTYQCNEELMVRLCHEAIASKPWADEHNKQAFKDCTLCELGPVTAFFAGESGLTRWQQYPTTFQHADPPSGELWRRGPTEPWYRAAAAAPDTLVVHVPVAPIRKLRNSFMQPPPLGMRYKWLTAARTLDHPDKANLGVTGYHFHPLHLEDYLRSVTMPCQSNSTCEAQCDGKEWSCLIVDDAGWIVAGHRRNEDDLTEDYPVTEHLARVYPHAMAALLEAKVFELNWIHDYQAVCFPPKDEQLKDGAMSMPSMLTSLWLSVNTVFCVSREIMTILTVIAYGTITSAETYAEREKRRRRLSRDFQREKYESLHDDRVLINRTRFAACDRSRVFYELRRTPKAMAALKQPASLCSWPLAGALLPGTNLLLLAVSNLCEHSGRPVPDPLVNIAVNMSGPDSLNHSSASRLACWRTRVPLPGRPPHSACFPHNYTHEEGYRQCGPWLPNPEQDEESNASHINVNNFILSLVLIFCLDQLLTLP